MQFIDFQSIGIISTFNLCYIKNVCKIKRLLHSFNVLLVSWIFVVAVSLLTMLDIVVEYIQRFPFLISICY